MSRKIFINNHSIEIIEADTFFKRLVGLLGKDSLSKDKGMLIKPCSSIHTFFMKFPIDVVFMDRRFKVIHIIENMQASKQSGYIKKSYQVLELSAGMCRKYGISKNSILDIVK